VSLHADVVLQLGTLDLAVIVDAQPGETVVLLGPNGAGKTTLLGALAGLLAVDRGHITLDDTTFDDTIHKVWVPPERPPSDGAYVYYPLHDLLGILALESTRNQCMVIGEDLGTVPEGFRERMEATGILSYRIIFFERRADGTPMWVSPSSPVYSTAGTISAHYW